MKYKMKMKSILARGTVRCTHRQGVWCPPGIDHWHGATPESPMTHLAITGVLDGKNVVWKEEVTDEQYAGK